MSETLLGIEPLLRVGAFVYYNVERMLKRALSGKGRVLLCGTCTDARGLTDAEMMAGAQRSTMDELAGAVVEANKLLVF